MSMRRGFDPADTEYSQGTERPRGGMGFSAWLAIAVIILVIAVCLGALFGCDRHHDGHAALPTVTPRADRVVCHDFSGRKPDRFFIPPRFERAEVCFICGTCYYGCPDGVGDEDP